MASRREPKLDDPNVAHAKQAGLIGLCLLVLPGVAACEASAAAPESHPPAVVEAIPGSDVKMVTLTDEAAAAAASRPRR